MKKVFKFLFLLPNIPFIIIIGIFVYIGIANNTNEIEFEFTKDFLTPELKQFILKFYPKWIQYLISIISWGAILFKIITQYVI